MIIQPTEISCGVYTARGLYNHVMDGTGVKNFGDLCSYDSKKEGFGYVYSYVGARKGDRSLPPGVVDRSMVGLVIWSDISFRKGEILAAYIEKHRLGKIERTEAEINPNSRNAIVVYTWHVPPASVVLEHFAKCTFAPGAPKNPWEPGFAPIGEPV